MREKKINEPTINGGSAGVTRAMYLGMALGYTDLQLHGADSSYKGNQTHITKSLAVETAIPVHVNGTTFYSTPGWCAQVDEFRRIYVGYRDKINIKVHGDGLLPYVYRHISDPSLKCTWESSEEQSPPEQKQPWWKSIFGLYRDLVGAH